MNQSMNEVGIELLGQLKIDQEKLHVSQLSERDREREGRLMRDSMQANTFLLNNQNYRGKVSIQVFEVVSI